MLHNGIPNRYYHQIIKVRYGFNYALKWFINKV